MRAESDLYAPVKVFLERLGYAVKGEVRGCDVVGTRGDDPPVIVELKRSFGLGLVLQGIDRLAITDSVYLGVGAWPRRLGDVRKLCRRVGLGLLVVARGRVEVIVDPEPYRPRRDARRLRRLLGEHARRVGDPNRGGSTRVPIMTAYRQEALRCAELLARHGPLAVAALRRAGDVPNAARILQRDVYGWFERVRRGTYAVSAGGRRGLETFGITAAVAATTAPADAA